MSLETRKKRNRNEFLNKKKQKENHEMKKLLCALLAALTLLASVVPVMAVDESQSYLFELSIDGSDTKQAAPGDIVTVALALKRTDADEGYTMYAMQDELCYDPEFFELVENSAMTAASIETTDIALRGGLRSFYMNFVSMGGGENWDASTMIGTFQLKVIGTSGSSVIRNTEMQVAVEGGMDSYAATGRDVTVVVTDECTVQFESNGGTSVPDQKVKLGQKVTRPEDPTKEGFALAGWYSDFDMTREWDFDKDTVQGSMTLYAEWVDASQLPAQGFHMPLWGWLALGAVLLAVLLILLLRRKTVKFETFGGTAIGSRKAKRGEKLTRPPVPEKEGCGFGGWYQDTACAKPWDFDNDKVEKSMTLYAKWL